MNSIKQPKIAILETRMSEELQRMISRYQGDPYHVAAMQIVYRGNDQTTTHLIQKLTEGEIPIVIFYTAVGVTSLFEEAQKANCAVELTKMLCTLTVICRGPKPAAVLRRYGIPISMNIESPFTTRELLNVLNKLELEGKDVLVVHYGERNEDLVQQLEKRQVTLHELCLYQWQLPVSIEPIKQLVRDMIDGWIDAIVFTCQIQARHLFEVAKEQSLLDPLLEALHTKIIIASIGPTCTEALKRYGITPHVVPDFPKMGHLVKSLAAYILEALPPGPRQED